MILTNDSGLPAAWLMGFRKDGRETMIVVVKATYLLPPNDDAPALAPLQPPLVEADSFTGEPGVSAPRHETDFAHYKPGCDVLLLGSAHAPEGRPAERCHVGLKVGSLVKQFAVVGNRHWIRSLVGSIAASAPEHFTVMPVGYDQAFGGVDRSREADGRIETFVANPAGKGFRRNTRDIDGVPLPNTEETGRAVTAPDGDYRPQAFSAIGRNWQPRAAYAGTYDRHWLENVAPLWPDDFDERYFQAAPPDQVIPYPVGGEEVILANLTPDGRRRFRLPSRSMPVIFIPHSGRYVIQQAHLDTLVLEPDAGSFTMTWRSVLPLGRSVFDVREVVVGEKTAGWLRAHRFPGKKYYASLAEAVRDNPRMGRVR